MSGPDLFGFETPVLDAAAIVKLAIDMRSCQVRYFKDRSRDALVASKAAEHRFDCAAADFLIAQREAGQ